MTVHASMSAWCSALTSGRWLRKASGPRISKRHFTYIDQRMELFATNPTMTKCQYQRVSLLASMSLREISNPVGSDPQDKITSLSNLIIFRCITVHLENTNIDTIQTTLIYTPPIEGASAGCKRSNSTYSMFRWPATSPLAVLIPLPISCTEYKTNHFPMLSLGTTLCGLVQMNHQEVM